MRHTRKAGEAQGTVDWMNTYLPFSILRLHLEYVGVGMRMRMEEEPKNSNSSPKNEFCRLNHILNLTEQ